MIDTFGSKHNFLYDFRSVRPFIWEERMLKTVITAHNIIDFDGLSKKITLHMIDNSKKSTYKRTT